MSDSTEQPTSRFMPETRRVLRRMSRSKEWKCAQAFLARFEQRIDKKVLGQFRIDV